MQPTKEEGFIAEVFALTQMDMFTPALFFLLLNT